MRHLISKKITRNIILIFVTIVLLNFMFSNYKVFGLSEGAAGSDPGVGSGMAIQDAVSKRSFKRCYIG